MDDITLNDWRDKCGEAAAENGWHDDFHKVQLSGKPQLVLDHVVAKTALIGCEVAEAIEEIRDGHEFAQTYYREVAGKPEGYPSELADVIIRALGLAYMLGIDIDQAVTEKLAYNATRGHKHGGKAL